MGSKIGVLKGAAAHCGLSLDEYLARLNNGLKRCVTCKKWKPLADYCADKSRPDGIDTRCLQCKRVKVRKSTKGRVSTFKGKYHSDESKQIISQKRKGVANKKPGAHWTEEMRQKASISRLKLGINGAKHPRWKGGVSQQNAVLRSNAEYKRWRRLVFQRDQRVCQICGSGENPNAHHIQAWASHPELRYIVSNGITLCDQCHKLVHKGEMLCPKPL